MYKLKSVHASTTEKYDFRFENFGYAIVFIDEVSGTISMKTDWGDYSFAWSKSARGTETLKEFLTSCDRGYLMNKFCSKSFFDEEATKKLLRKEMKNVFLDTETKKKCMAEIRDAEFNSSDEIWASFDGRCPTYFVEVMKCDMYGLPVVVDYSPADSYFFKSIWPTIVRYLKKEIKKKGGSHEQKV